MKVIVPPSQIAGVGRRAIGRNPVAAKAPKEPDKEVVLERKR
jgi:hypothetical protein